MAITCNAFDGNTAELRDALCQVQNSGTCVPSRTITCDELLTLLVAVMIRNTEVDITDATSTDLETVTENALCALQSMALPSVDRDKLAAYALFVINEAYCQYLTA